jgi:hypothetical protein
MMVKTKFLAAAFLLVASAATVSAQQPAAVLIAERSDAQPQGCVKDNRPGHDHGMVKGTGPAGMLVCEGAGKKADTTQADSGSAKKGHDHGKFHKGK